MNNDAMEYNEAEEIEEMRQHLLRTTWIEEAKQIPLYDVNDRERELLIQCIQEEPFNEEELQQLEQLLGRYRKSLQKYEPIETLEAVEKNVQIVQDEKEILRLMKEDKEEQTLHFNYPLSNGQILRYDLVIEYEIDAEALDLLQENVELFGDVSREELDLFRRYSNDEKLSREDVAIAQSIQRKIEQTGQHNVSRIRETAIKFLARQTKIKDSTTCTEEDMKEIYDIMKLGPLLALFREVQTMVGVSDISRTELFQ